MKAISKLEHKEEKTPKMVDSQFSLQFNTVLTKDKVASK